MHLPLIQDRKPSPIQMVVLTLIVMTAMLYFGTRLKGFRSENNVHWLAGHGLAFDRFGVAYTDGFFPVLDGDSGGGGLTIEMAVRPEFSRYPDLIRFILLVHGAGDRDQLMIGQWRSTLIVMNGNDYGNSLKTPKIYLPLDQYEGMTHLITVVSNGSGTKVFVDGALAEKNRALVLKYPHNAGRARMTVGNSLSGKRPWIGTMLGLALYDHDLTDELVQQHYRQWRLNSDFSAFRPDAPRLLYAFNEGKGEKVKNRTGNGMDLIVPAGMTVLQKEILTWHRWNHLGIKSLAIDSLINLAGFIPLGFLLIATLVRFEGMEDRTGILIAVLIAFFFSLAIEIVQVWIPSRDSSMLDLISNTLGSCIGILLYMGLKKMASRADAHPDRKQRQRY